MVFHHAKTAFRHKPSSFIIATLGAITICRQNTQLNFVTKNSTRCSVCCQHFIGSLDKSFLRYAEGKAGVFFVPKRKIRAPNIVLQNICDSVFGNAIHLIVIVQDLAFTR